MASRRVETAPENRFDSNTFQSSVKYFFGSTIDLLGQAAVAIPNPDSLARLRASIHRVLSRVAYHRPSCPPTVMSDRSGYRG